MSTLILSGDDYALFFISHFILYNYCGLIGLGGFMKSIATTIELRQKNRRELLNLLIKQGQTTRNDLRNLSGFSYTTIGNLLSDLKLEDFILQQGVAQSTGGRQAQVTKINPDKAYFISIDISTHTFKWGIYNLEGERINENSYDSETNSPFHEHFNSMIDDINRVCLDLDIKERVESIGIVITGYYSSSDDKIFDSYDEEKMGDLRIKKSINTHFQVPFTVKNDAKTAAFNEVKNIKNPQSSQLYYIMILKEGLGSAFLLNGEVYQGSKGFAGEIYPITQICNGEEKSLGELLNPQNDLALLQDRLKMQIDDKTFFDSYKESNPVALEIYKKNVTSITKGIIPILCILNPSHIRIGGYYNGYGEKLIRDIKEELQRSCEYWQYENLNIELTDLSTYTLSDSLATQLIGLWANSLWIN